MNAGPLSTARGAGCRNSGFANSTCPTPANANTSPPTVRPRTHHQRDNVTLHERRGLMGQRRSHKEAQLSRIETRRDGVHARWSRLIGERKFVSDPIDRVEK